MREPVTLQRKPTTIQAMQWTGRNAEDLKRWGAPVTWLGSPQPTFDEFDNDTRYDLWLWVAANGASLRLEIGEWIAQDELGYYPIKDKMIQKNYDVVEVITPQRKSDNTIHEVTDA